MKTQINLYLDEFKPKADLLGLPVVASVWLLLVVFVGLLFWVGKSRLDASQDQLWSLQTQLTEQRELTEQLKQKSLQHVEDPQLRRAIAQQSLTIKHQRTILKALQQHKGTKNSGYAQLMADLANFHSSSIWLTGVTYRADTIVLSGATMQPEKITQWLARLSRSTYFSGTEFSNLNIVSDDGESFSRFTVATSATQKVATER